MWTMLLKKLLLESPLGIDHRIILHSRIERERISHLRGEVVFDESNAPVRIKGTVQDITERKIAEQKIQQSEAKYRSSS